MVSNVYKINHTQCLVNKTRNIANLNVQTFAFLMRVPYYLSK